MSVDNVAVEEYEDDDDVQTDDAVVKYIEAASGAEFAIDCELSSPWPKHSLLMDIFVDGEWVRGMFFKEDGFIGASANREITGVYYTKNEEWYLQKFCFSDVVIGTSFPSSENSG